VIWIWNYILKIYNGASGRHFGPFFNQPDLEGEVYPEIGVLWGSFRGPLGVVDDQIPWRIKVSPSRIWPLQKSRTLIPWVKLGSFGGPFHGGLDLIGPSFSRGKHLGGGGVFWVQIPLGEILNTILIWPGKSTVFYPTPIPWVKLGSWRGPFYGGLGVLFTVVET
jgi:hypothetical protein